MSTLKADTIQNTSGGAATLTKQQAAKAYINQDEGTSIIKSFNVASLVDNATGDYIVNFTNNMSDVNYIPTSASNPQDFTSGGVSILHGTRSHHSDGTAYDVAADHFHQRVGKVSSSAVDSDSVRSTVHGDLA